MFFILGNLQNKTKKLQFKTIKKKGVDKDKIKGYNQKRYQKPYGFGGMKDEKN